MSMNCIDPVCVPDVFATELICIENLGGVFRFTFATCQAGERIVVARIIMIGSAIPMAVAMTTEVVSGTYSGDATTHHLAH